MEREKMIEEMAKDIFDCHDALEGIDFAFGHGKGTHFDRMAVKLVNVGYRKVPEGAAVLTREELANHDEQVEKDTVKKVLDAIGTKCSFCGVGRCVCTRKVVEEIIKEKLGVVVE